jgi:hypothetical protein
LRTIASARVRFVPLAASFVLGSSQRIYAIRKTEKPLVVFLRFFYCGSWCPLVRRVASPGMTLIRPNAEVPFRAASQISMTKPAEQCHHLSHKPIVAVYGWKSDIHPPLFADKA